MSPTLVLRPDGRLLMVVGSAGGSAIINHVAKTLVAVLDWGLGIQQAIELPNMGSRGGPTEIERGGSSQALEAALESMGHEVVAIQIESGLQGILVTPSGLTGGTDPRREGVVLGN